MSVLITSAVIINRPKAEVFEFIRDVQSHTAWMIDAKSIEIISDVKTGIGLRFRCETRLGPLHTSDIMEITGWHEGELISIAHRGLIQGEGTFKLQDYGFDRTLFCWEEQLEVPFLLGGQITGAIIMPILRLVFQRDLRNLRRLIEATPTDSASFA